jgi:homocysteine S-methyltransferase
MTFESLPQLSGGLFLGDGGIETSLIFLQGAVLPEFASFVLVLEPQGRDKLRKYYEPFLELCASTPDAGFVLDTPTWRASADWSRRLATCYVISSLPAEASRILHAVRTHWGIESVPQAHGKEVQHELTDCVEATRKMRVFVLLC